MKPGELADSQLRTLRQKKRDPVKARGDSAMTRENLYVALTRAREDNMAYVAVDKPDLCDGGL